MAAQCSFINYKLYKNKLTYFFYKQKAKFTYLLMKKSIKAKQTMTITINCALTMVMIAIIIKGAANANDKFASCVDSFISSPSGLHSFIPLSLILHGADREIFVLHVYTMAAEKLLCTHTSMYIIHQPWWQIRFSLLSLDASPLLLCSSPVVAASTTEFSLQRTPAIPRIFFLHAHILSK